jgi:cobalamin-dependent methionine synthase I
MFVVVGERINTSRKKVQKAVASRDAAAIQDDVRKQHTAGAAYIDVNAGARIGHEMEDMQWLIEVIQDAVAVPLCLDSPDPEVLAMAYERVKEPPLINSISLESERYDAMIPFLQGRDCSVVALCMDDTGMPTAASQIVQRAQKLVARLEGIGMKRDAIFLDFLAQPVSTNTLNGPMVMEAVRGIREQIPGVHTICGLSNISFGLPQRKIINRTFLAMMMASGLDAAVLDPLDRELMATLKTAGMLIGNDPYCKTYLKAVRAGEIQA